MACLNLTSGPLLPPDVAWRQAASVTTPNGTVITHTPGGGFPGVSVVKGSSNQFFAKAPSGPHPWEYPFGNQADPRI